MGRPSKYSAEFKADAIALYRSGGGRRTFKQVGEDLGVNPETLRSWVRDAQGRERHPGGVGAAGAVAEPVADELARLREENARLVKAEREWQLEREILRRAAQYFAKEMR